MKNIFKSLIALKLSIFARIIIRRYGPKIVLITGSVGKTATKDAVAAVLSKYFFVRKSEKSFNSEFGVPFTIFGVENPWNNPLSWLKVIKNIVALLFLPNHYPNLLVLEVGADRPGDLSRILRMVPPDMVVVTRLPEISVHVEAYSSPEAVREEEFSPAYALNAESPLIISADDHYSYKNAARTPARVISYGTTSCADAQVSNVDFYKENGDVIGMEADIKIGENFGKLIVRNSVGMTQLLPIAAALAAAQAFGISFHEAMETLKDYEPPPGRCRILRGINNSVIIDDSYNSSPAAVEEALSTLKKFPHAKRRVAILGDMLELGRYSVMEHERLGKIAGNFADLIITIGVRARAFASTPQNAEVLCFDNSYSAAKIISTIIRDGDVILIKGSQAIRTERVVESLLANPSDSVHLVRQENKWKQKL